MCNRHAFHPAWAFLHPTATSQNPSGVKCFSFTADKNLIINCFIRCFYVKYCTRLSRSSTFFAMLKWLGWISLGNLSCQTARVFLLESSNRVSPHWNKSRWTWEVEALPLLFFSDLNCSPVTFVFSNQEMVKSVWRGLHFQYCISFKSGVSKHIHRWARTV